MQQQEPQCPQAQKRSRLEDQTSLPSRVPILEPRGLRKPEAAEGAALAPAPALHSAVAPGFHGTRAVSANFRTYGAPAPVPSGSLFTASIWSLQRSCSKPLFPAPSLPQGQEARDSAWDAWGCRTDPAGFVLLPTDHLWQPPLIPKVSFGPS